MCVCVWCFDMKVSLNVPTTEQGSCESSEEKGKKNDDEEDNVVNDELSHICDTVSIDE